MHHSVNTTIRRFLTVLIAFFMCLNQLPVYVNAEEVTENDQSGHYLAFSTDRHGTETAISEAMGAMNIYPVEYVSMIGDMVGSGGNDAPEYNTSVVLNEVQAVFPQLDNSNVSIVYGSHDAGAIDDAGILLCKEPGSSHLIYTGYEEDRSIAYYVYGIAYDDMLDPAYAAASAENFKYWLNTEAEPNVPLFVLCHVPIHAMRGDNLGASYWNAALNYAATGSDNGTEIIRNVVFLHGHNHTNEKTEYYYEPGQSITVQGESSNSTFSSAIYYTYITAGYLKGMSTKNASLIHFDDQELSFTKYNGSTPTLLGTAQRVRELVSAGPENLSFSAGSYEYSFGDTISVMDLLEQSEEELDGVSLSVERSAAENPRLP